MSIRILQSLRSFSSLGKDFKILGLDYPSSRFNKESCEPKKNIKNKSKNTEKKIYKNKDRELNEYDILFGLEFPSSRFK